MQNGLDSDQKASVSSSPLLDNQGRFMGAVLVIRDITLLNKLKRQLCEQHQYHHIIGRSKKMRDLFCLLEKLSDMDTTVLVTGESGTGKELIAKALHHGSHRAFKPFISVNCSALAENLLESELFGHVRGGGAFTGAFKDSQGRFQAAGSGTVLLDEVGDISPLIQLKLLRVLQDKQYERVGESVARNMNARIVACTNADLKQKVSRGEFREDLYYRLKVMEIALPPLRERMEDVPLLASHFCSLFNQRFGKEIEGFSKDALAKLMNYSWPGNIRELEHAIERAFVLCSKKMITPEHLPAEILDCCRTPAANGTVVCLITPDNFFREVVSEQKPVLILCMPCNEQFPCQLRIMEDLARLYHRRLKVGLFKQSFLEIFKESMKICGTPTYLMMLRGQEINRMIGIADRKALAEFALSHQ